MQRLLEHAEAANSDGLVLIRNARVIVDETFGKRERPIYISSAGKSLVSMGIGHLLHTGHIESLDTPVWTFFPEWKQGLKQEITIRHLLNHTSGLQNNTNASVELEPPPNWRVADVVRLALAAELTEAPGDTFRYNNKAVALLGGIIERASGHRMDAYFETEFFRPLGITEYDWIRDEANQPTAHGAFVISARSLARFGEVMLAGGALDGTSFFDATWVDASFYADGYRGNYLVVVPTAGIVAARVKGHSADIDLQRDMYCEFVDDIVAIATACQTPAGRRGQR